MSKDINELKKEFEKLEQEYQDRPGDKNLERKRNKLLGEVMKQMIADLTELASDDKPEVIGSMHHEHHHHHPKIVPLGFDKDEKKAMVNFETYDATDLNDMVNYIIVCGKLFAMLKKANNKASEINDMANGLMGNIISAMDVLKKEMGFDV
ncbi:hypothetical protein Zmor_008806 [Zophobas morio]|uniref:Uncharacterized protein n=1 Tax=Zophobas morio TaxID=2755281 RepID=A0AA38HJR4_9CUCU|nr:hypothetical protein Zmor_008806 [Zophobas morio]